MHLNKLERLRSESKLRERQEKYLVWKQLELGLEIMRTNKVKELEEIKIELIMLKAKIIIGKIKTLENRNRK